MSNSGIKSRVSPSPRTVKRPAKKKSATAKRTSPTKATPKGKGGAIASAGGSASNYPRHTFSRSLRIPAAILNQNGGNDCTEKEAATFANVGYNGPFRLEISSAIKFGLLERPLPRTLQLTELARRILRPQEPGDELKATRESVLQAPVVKDVYSNYRGEYLPDRKFLDNAFVDKFHIDKDKISDFYDIFLDCLESASLIQKEGDRIRLLDVSDSVKATGTPTLKTMAAAAGVHSGDTCFVMMPFADPIGGYYEKIYEPAIIKAGLIPVRADNEIFATGKIIDQIWRGIHKAKVLVAELTTKNPNVFYELGLAHALEKPVVLISASEPDVPFDLKHIRVIYYDMADPFWGQKLMEKVSENVLSAIQNPEEAVFKTTLD